MEGKILYLEKGERKIIGEKCYEIISGKIVAKDVLPNGKAIGHELFLEEKEIITNFYNLFLSTKKDKILQDGEIEIEALEDSKLLEIQAEVEELSEEVLTKMALQLTKRSMLKYYYQIYDSIGYVLAVLKFYADDKGVLKKEDISPESFSMIGKSQFYEIYKKIKKRNYLFEFDNRVILEMEKIEDYLNESHLNGKKRRRINGMEAEK